MPPIVATILCIGLVGYLFRRTFRAQPNVTAALWIPFAWFFLICTRTFSQWLSTFGVALSGNTYEEGNTLDAVIFFGIIIAGVMVLQRRHFNLAAFMQDNRWLAAFLIYSLVSVLWADEYMFVSFKRWIKVMGHPIMVLVLLSEPEPEEAIIQLIKRCAFIIFPVSILFIKYYPGWGRIFDPFIGAPSNTGIALDKNMLGSVCMISGMFLFWYHLKVRQTPFGLERRNELRWNAILLVFILWVLYLAHSSTALVSMLVGIAIILFLGLESVNRRKLTAYLFVGVAVIGLAQWSFDLYGLILNILGKDSTLTDRTKVWGEVLKVSINPLIGTGFESFWLGERRQALWDIYWWHPIQAHNGYLETYLNIGVIGLGFMVMLIVCTYQKACRSLLARIDLARFRLGFLAAFVLYNWTEAAFKALHPVFFIFFLVLMDFPFSLPAKVEKTGAMVDT